MSSDESSSESGLTSANDDQELASEDEAIVDSVRHEKSESQSEHEEIEKEVGNVNESDSNEESSRSPPSERRPEDQEADAFANDSDIDLSADEAHSTVARDIKLSDSNSNRSSDDENRDVTEDDIVGPRLYPDPDVAGEGERVEPTIVEVNTARICPKFTEDGLFFVKFPNFLSIEPRPFDREHYEDEFDEDDLLDEEGRARLKLRVENTIRWRYVLDESGNIVKQGNSKIIRWSDGTMSLYLGNEIFDVKVQSMQQDNHLFLRQGAGLQGHAVFKEKLIFRPYSTESITHRKVTLSMADRSNKSQKVKVLTAVGSNPESKKAEIVRKEEERMRAQNRREAQQRRNRNRLSARSGLTSSFLEDREDESDEESISLIKNRYKHGVDDKPLIGHSDSEDSDSKRLQNAKNAGEESDSDQEIRKQKKKKVIIDDDDDDDNVE